MVFEAQLDTLRRLNNSQQNLISYYKVSKILYSRKEVTVYRKTNKFLADM